VFLIYNDLRWPPEKERLADSDRFVLMFAPSRLYDQPYEVPPAEVRLPSYHRNQYKANYEFDPPVNPVSFLREWQKVSGFRGLGFAFDYHMINHHYYDMGYYGMTEVLAEDIRRLPQIGLHGFVSCQNVRAWFPHGFPLYVHAKLLWNPEYRTEDLAWEYFAGAFGEDGPLVLEYMKTLSDLSSFNYFPRMQRIRSLPPDDERAELVEKLVRIPDVVERFRPVIARNETTGDPAHQASWKLLSVHSGMVLKMADVLRARAEDRQEREDDTWKKLLDYLALHEDDTDDVFDIKLFQGAVQRRR
jgi:hypothetical protein